jgi:hypothetical protein
MGIIFELSHKTCDRLCPYKLGVLKKAKAASTFVEAAVRRKMIGWIGKTKALFSPREPIQELWNAPLSANLKNRA